MRRRLTASGGGTWISIYDLPVLQSDSNTGYFPPSGITVYGIKWKRGRQYNDTVYNSPDATYTQYQPGGGISLCLWSVNGLYYNDPFVVHGYGMQYYVYAGAVQMYGPNNDGKYVTVSLSNIGVTPEVDGDYWVLLYDNIPATYNGIPKSPITNAYVGSDRIDGSSNVVNTFRTAGVDVQVLVE